MPTENPPHKSKSLAIWLFTCAAMVFSIAIIGAITRLTESGLSIVEWNPIKGILPPLNEAEWLKEFDLYKNTPQFKEINASIDLTQFKEIFFWEWLHRLLGRLVGMVYFIPFVYFWLRKQIPHNAKKPLIIILLLGFAQGFMGWLMVYSGLIDRPSVSHYRLAAHLGLAFILFSYMLYMALSFSYSPLKNAEGLCKLRKLVITTLSVISATMLWGVFTAGLDAGLIYNDNFPFMGEKLCPEEIFYMHPAWLNFFENSSTVQFTHRLLAVASFITAEVLMVAGLIFNVSLRIKRLLIALVAAVTTQVILGSITIATTVKISVAVIHQGTALVIISLLVALLYETSAKKQIATEPSPEQDDK